MSRAKLIGMAITAAVAISAIASVTASALPEFLPGAAGTKFTSFSGSGTLATASGVAITCKADTDNGELLSKTTMTVTIDFTGCTLFGIVNAHSLGDASGTILTTATGALCYLSKTNKTVGVELTPTGKVHIEVGSELTLIEGTVIGELTPVNVSTKGPAHLILEQSANGKQKILTCEGGTEKHLTSAKNEGASEAASEATTDTIGWLVTAQELMA
jgi:hypothetical protein